MEAWREELYHHGIKGQRWGRLNGPPYPLDPDDHSASEKKAGWRKSLKEKHQARVAKKEEKRKQERERLEKSFKNPNSSEEAENALKRTIQNDIEKDQTKLGRIVGRLSGYNREASEFISDKIITDMKLNDIKNMRSTMSNGQKFVDYMTNSSTNRAEENYSTKGYKQISKEYQKYKEQGGLDKGQKQYRSYKAEQYRRQQREIEARRREQERNRERDREEELREANEKLRRSRSGYGYYF